jgi:hypothetical protein
MGHNGDSSKMLCTREQRDVAINGTCVEEVQDLLGISKGVPRSYEISM